MEILQSPLSKERGQKEDEELENNNSHSTCTASKAVGQLYGTAKGATLVVVKLAGYDIAEASEAFDLIGKDLKAHPERKGNSIVTMSMSSDDPGMSFHSGDPLNGRRHVVNASVFSIVAKCACFSIPSLRKRL